MSLARASGSVGDLTCLAVFDRREVEFRVPDEGNHRTVRRKLGVYDRPGVGRDQQTGGGVDVILNVGARVRGNLYDVTLASPRVPDYPLPQLPLALSEKLLFQRELDGIRVYRGLDDMGLSGLRIERVELAYWTLIRAIQVRKQSVIGTEGERDGVDMPGGGNFAISSMGIFPRLVDMYCDCSVARLASESNRRLPTSTAPPSRSHCRPSTGRPVRRSSPAH